VAAEFQLLSGKHALARFGVQLLTPQALEHILQVAVVLPKGFRKDHIVESVGAPSHLREETGGNLADVHRLTRTRRVDG
jgi:hypothetical protein